MKGTWWEGIRDRIRSTWDVLIGRAYASYSIPDQLSEVRLRMALIEMQQRDERNGSLPAAYRSIIDHALQ
jgi:hypothetical protein